MNNLSQACADAPTTQPTISLSETSALLFDMDGTIVHNMLYHHRAWQELLKELGLDWSIERVQAEIWGKNEDIFERIFPGKYSKSEARELALKKERRYIECYTPDAQLLPGLEQVLASAKEVGLKLAIATAAPPICLEFVMNFFKLERFFDAVVHADEVAHSKPHPESYLVAAARVGVKPDRCLVFEDAPVGVKSAEAAGIRSYVLLTTHQQAEFKGFSSVKGFLHDYQSFIFVP